MTKLNWNATVKVKLTDYGKKLYTNICDDLIVSLINNGIKYKVEDFNLKDIPVDVCGYSAFHLWEFMKIFGEYIYMGGPNIVEDVSFYIEDEEFIDDETRTNV